MALQGERGCTALLSCLPSLTQQLLTAALKSLLHVKQEAQFTVKSRQNEMASTVTISEWISVSGKGIFSFFFKAGLEELKGICFSPHRRREAPRGPWQVRISITGNQLHNQIEHAQNSYASTKEASLSKDQMPSQTRTFSDVKLCPLTRIDRKLFKPKTTFGPSTGSLPVCSSGWCGLCCKPGPRFGNKLQCLLK